MTHDPNTLRIVIPTYRRNSFQMTFSHIPKEWRPRTTFVVDARDAVGLTSLFGHTGAEILVHPPEIQTIAAKRAWIINQQQWSKVLMLDDDLRPCYRQNALKVVTAEQMAMGLKAVEDKLDEVVHCGLASRQGNNHFADGWNANKRMMYALGYKTDVVREICELGRIDTREDFDYGLQLLRKGFPNAVFADVCVDQRGYAKGGGCQAEGRTVEKSNADAEKLASLHPGLVKVVDKEYKTTLHRKEVIVYWKKAYEQGQGAVL